MKLTAKELRIGNWIKAEPLTIPRLNIKSNGWMKVTGYGISVLESDTKVKLPWEPIPLTEEILLKCGFEKNISNDNEEREIFSIQISNNSYLYFDRHKNWMRNDVLVEWYISHEWNNNHFKNDLGWVKINYLHQLQNLYFALTGKELEIKF